MEVGRVLESFILKFVQQEEALHCIWYNEKMATLRLLVTVTRWRGARWRWGTCQGASPQVCAVRRGSSSHLVCSQEVATFENYFSHFNTNISLPIMS
ncbi:unnamed protein product [Spirodela intermedia]|uniref:Uncharacterized protein n=1 Tax=Spirodela intermedia TaxID=51605 RepID=A0ABN7E9P7_SPIIN|nr:unnamed protein product [Spirodela intermedia]